MPRILHYSSNPNKNVDNDNIVIIPDDSDFIPFGQSADLEVVFEENSQPEEIEITPQEKATLEAEEILNKARCDADQIINDALKQGDEIKAQAKSEAFDEAFAQKSEIISQTLTKLYDTMEKIETEENSFIEEYEKTVSSFAVSIASSILKHELRIDPLAMCDLVENAMSTIKDAKWAVLTLSNELVPLVELLQSELAEKCATIARLDVLGKPVSKGTCLIDSPQGIVDASIDTQLRNLLHRFSQIQQKRGQE